MAHRVTNAKLNQLLVDLGFEQGPVAEKNHCVWRHPQSGCTLLLPRNKLLEPPRPADLVGIRAQLDLHGHLDEETFEIFLSEGNLPTRTSERQ